VCARSPRFGFPSLKAEKRPQGNRQQQANNTSYQEGSERLREGECMLIILLLLYQHYAAEIIRIIII